MIRIKFQYFLIFCLLYGLYSCGSFLYSFRQTHETSIELRADSPDGSWSVIVQEDDYSMPLPGAFSSVWIEPKDQSQPPEEIIFNDAPSMVKPKYPFVKWSDNKNVEISMYWSPSLKILHHYHSNISFNVKVYIFNADQRATVARKCPECSIIQ